MVAIPQLAFANVTRSARTKDRKIDFDFPDLSTGYLQQTPASFPLKGKRKRKSTLRFPGRWGLLSMDFKK